MKSVYPFSRKLLADRKISDAEKMTKTFWLLEKFQDAEKMTKTFWLLEKFQDAEKTTKSENFWLIDKFLMPKKRLSQKIFG